MWAIWHVCDDGAWLSVGVYDAHLLQYVHDEAQAVNVDDGAAQLAGSRLHVICQRGHLAIREHVQVITELDLPIATLLLKLAFQIGCVQRQRAYVVQWRQHVNFLVHRIKAHQLTLVVIKLRVLRAKQNSVGTKRSSTSS